MIVRRFHHVLSGIVAAALLAGCALLPAVNTDRATDGLPTPTPIPTAVVPVKPTYVVQRGELVSQLEFSGRISPQLEEDLFFRTDGRVRTVLAKRNDMVTEGQILAELEIDGLERELETAQLELERAQVRLEQAEGDHAYQLAVAQTNLEMAQLRLQAMQSGAAPDLTAIAIQEKEVELAQLEVDRLAEGIDPFTAQARDRRMDGFCIFPADCTVFARMGVEPREGEPRPRDAEHAGRDRGHRRQGPGGQAR